MRALKKRLLWSLVSVSSFFLFLFLFPLIWLAGFAVHRLTKQFEHNQRPKTLLFVCSRRENTCCCCCYLLAKQDEESKRNRKQSRLIYEPLKELSAYPTSKVDAFVRLVVCNVDCFVVCCLEGSISISISIWVLVLVSVTVLSQFQ